MDVTCERCGTEYEFDETLVSERGTTVKCTNCGFLFKVFPPGAGPEAELGDRAWIVRRRRGGEERLGSLRELQQRIAQGALEEDDELSRSGRQWKRLGDIAELQTFFRAADAARTAPASDAPPADARKRTLFGVGAAPSVPAPPPPPSPRPDVRPAESSTLDAPTLDAPPRRDPTGPVVAPRRDPTPASVRPPPPSAPPPRRDPTPASVRPPPPSAPPPARRDPTPASVRPPAPTPPSTPPRPASDATARPRGRTAPLGSPEEGTGGPTAAPARGELRPPKPALYLDEDAVAAPLPPTKSRVGLWAFLVILVAGGIAVAIQWDAIAPKLGLASDDDALVARLQASEVELAKHTVDGYDAALREYLRASALAERDPRVLAGLARTEVAWAEALELEASDLEANGDTAAATRLRAEVARHAREARTHAEAWLAVEPSLAPEVVLGDALRLAGDRADAQRRLERALELANVSPPTGQVASELALLRAALVEEEAVAATGRAVEADPSIRARLRAARARLVARDVEGARAALAAIFATAADHPRARALASAMDEGRPPAAPIVEVADAGVPSETPRPESETPRPETPRAETPRTETPRAETPRSETPRAETGGAPEAGRDYSHYVRRGDQLLDGGDVAGARAHFELALQQRPGGSEALTGLGYAALRAGNPSEAARHFRPAARNDYGDAYIGLGEAYRRMGQHPEALQTYRAYLASRPNGPHASVARAQIAALEAASASTPPPAPPNEPAPSMNEPSTNEPAPPSGAPEPSPEPSREPSPEPSTP